MCAACLYSSLRTCHCISRNGMNWLHTHLGRYDQRVQDFRNEYLIQRSASMLCGLTLPYMPTPLCMHSCMASCNLMTPANVRDDLSLALGLQVCWSVPFRTAPSFRAYVVGDSTSAAVQVITAMLVQMIQVT